MKVWMVRTKSNFLLGPISKEKLIELMESDSVLPEDEVSSGNGHWFFFRELSLVKKYIYGNEIQSFNPVSEALLERLEKQATEDTPGPIEREKDITLFNFQGRKS
ncbi:MAG: hypothetical protein QE271_00870 [Bacteriovoracaceae bacterium]|nr:hypothetical protein [Bacteriovoracaceae bacterium]